MVQVPVKDAGSVTPFENVWLLRPATPVMTIGFVFAAPVILYQVWSFLSPALRATRVDPVAILRHD